MLAFTLDARMTSSLDAAANTMAASSAFLRQHSFGVLVDTAADAARPMDGRLLRWEIAQQQVLRIIVCVESSTRGYIEVGSVASISADQHEAFLCAVESAYPITDGSTFTCTPIAKPEAEVRTAKATSARAMNRMPAHVPAASHMETDSVGVGAAISKHKKGKKSARNRGPKKPKQHEQPRKGQAFHPKPRPSSGVPSAGRNTSRNRTWVRPGWKRSVRVSN